MKFFLLFFNKAEAISDFKNFYWENEYVSLFFYYRILIHISKFFFYITYIFFAEISDFF